MKPLKIKVSITLDDDIVYRIKQLSEQDDRSFSQYINIVLKRHIAEKETTRQETKQ
ncbi:MAG: toxin-antitoxin system protein [Ruminococcus sp.]|nr:toxin-antitoxin system protein [Ruminococcus sp.]